MSVKCLLCEEEFRAITPTHLKAIHSTTLADYRVRFPGTEVFSEETKQLMVHDEEARHFIIRDMVLIV